MKNAKLLSTSSSNELIHAWKKSKALVFSLNTQSVPAHVEMMGLIGMGNNPMVGATVAVAVAVEEALK